MKCLEIVKRLCYMHDFIVLEKTGTPNEFAKHLHISRRQLYHIFEEVADYGVVVKYDRTRQTFYYEGDFHVIISKLHLSSPSE